MKHLLNDLSSEEKNRIREQYEGGMSVDTSKFKNLVETKLGDPKPLVNEDFTIDGVEDFDFPEDPSRFNKWHIEELLKVYDVDGANEILDSHYPGYSLEIKMETPYGKSIGFMSPKGEEISGNYLIGCCGGRGSSENMDRFRRSDDAFYEPRKKY